MKKYLYYWLPLIAHAALIYFLSSREAFPIEPPPWAEFSDKIAHICIFGLLAYLGIRAWRMETIEKVSIKALVIITICVSLYGVTDEVHQLYVPNRETSVYDWLADTFGAMMVSMGYWKWQQKDDTRAVSSEF